MLESKPISGYNLPPGCFEHDIDAYFGEGKPTCAECKHMVECCCDYGICRREYQEALDNEFCECEGQIKLTKKMMEQIGRCGGYQNTCAICKA